MAQAPRTILAALPVCRNGASTRAREVTTASLETGVRRRRESGGILATVLPTMRGGIRCLKSWTDVVGARSWVVDFVEAKVVWWRDYREGWGTRTGISGLTVC